MKKRLRPQAENTTNGQQKSTDNQSVEGNDSPDPLQNKVLSISLVLFTNSPYDKLICYKVEQFESYISTRFELFKSEFLLRLTQSKSSSDIEKLKADLAYEESHLNDQISSFFETDEFLLGHDNRMNARCESIELIQRELLNLERKILLYDREDRNKNPQIIELRAKRDALKYENVFADLQFNASERSKKNLFEYILTECTLLKLRITHKK